MAFPAPRPAISLSGAGVSVVVVLSDDGVVVDPSVVVVDSPVVVDSCGVSVVAASVGNSVVVVLLEYR
jgi:hypothetical protein